MITKTDFNGTVTELDPAELLRLMRNPRVRVTSVSHDQDAEVTRCINQDTGEVFNITYTD